jgi:hypothetical protein
MKIQARKEEVAPVQLILHACKVVFNLHDV